jgi:arginyl-tRNA synthetase
MWGIIENLEGEYPEKLNAINEQERADWISKCYVRGNEAYESGSKKEEIVEINKHVYRLHTDNEHDSPFAQIYWTCREWSYDYFYSFYKSIGTAFEKYYPESETAPIGLETVKKELKSGVYEESNGAVVFNGEKYGLHTRVFINSEGLPTYEAKDVGLAIKKWQDYKFDRSIMITGNDIVEYMKVVMKSIEQYAPEITDRTIHITHGMVKLKGGIKMSSRQGNFLKAVDVLQIVVDENLEANPTTVLAAIKYAFLKYSIGGDISFDPKESIAMEGNSGPYLQYAHARAKSILRKSDFQSPEIQTDTTLDTHERSLVRKLSEYSEVIEKAIFELAPHVICAYLYELSQEFNRFYENSTVIGDNRELLRIGLVNKYANTLKDGLTLLGIEAPDSM